MSNADKYDVVESLPDGSVIQHGECNNRIYLMKKGSAASEELAKLLISKAEECGYSKIFAKVPFDSAAGFVKHGYRVEADIPGFYNGFETGVFLAFYLGTTRQFESDTALFENNMQLAEAKKSATSQSLNKRFSLRKCSESDVAEMATIYRRVFPSYPFPIHDPDYLLMTMRDNVDYFCIETKNKEVVALASAEMDPKALNVEMTDFATLPEWCGNGLSIHLLQHMEQEMEQKSIQTAYTIARAASPGMNITFRKQGYQFSGRLKNNTNISGQIESMNVWYKPLITNS